MESVMPGMSQQAISNDFLDEKRLRFSNTVRVASLAGFRSPCARQSRFCGVRPIEHQPDQRHRLRDRRGGKQHPPLRTAQQEALMRSRTADPSRRRRGAPLPAGRQRAGRQRSHHAAAQVPRKYTYHGQRCRAERRARPGCLQPGGPAMHGDRWGAREPARGCGGGGSR